MLNVTSTSANILKGIINITSKYGEKVKYTKLSNYRLSDGHFISMIVESKDNEG